jgi:hypothetical protein
LCLARRKRTKAITARRPTVPTTIAMISGVFRLTEGVPVDVSGALEADTTDDSEADAVGESV